MPRTSFRLWGTIVVLSSIAAPLWGAGVGVPATTLPVLVFRSGEHETFDRLVFDAPRGFTYHIARAQAQITVTFSAAAKLVLGPSKLTRVKNIHIIAGTDGVAPLSVQFTVNSKATIKDFMSGTSVVLDVAGGQAAPSDQAETSATATPVPVSPPHPAAAPSLSPTPKEPVASALSDKKPESPAPQPASPPVAVAVPPPKMLQVDVPPSPSGSSALAPSPQPAPVSAVHQTEASPPPAPRLFVAPKIAMDPKIIEQVFTILSEKPALPVAVLDPKIAIGTAIFTRGGYVNILFDRKLAGDSLISSPPPRLKLEPLNLPYNTGFRIAVPDGVTVRATRRDTAWEIYLVKVGTEAALSTEFVVQPEFALGGRLLVATASPPAAFFYPDPVVGDDLIVLPLRETGAFTIKRRLADFQVIPAAQGLVIKPTHERVVARTVPDGVEITSEGGLKLSPSQDTGAAPVTQDDVHKHAKEIFAFDIWGGAGGSTFTETRLNLLQTIVDVKEEERVLARLDLARFYFSHAMGAEALSILSVIKTKLPEMENHPDFLAVRGGARILVGQYQEGLDDLNHPSLRDQAEVILWRAVASAGLRDWISALEQFTSVSQLLASYPEPFRSRFSILAIESAVAEGQDQKAVEWLTQLEKRGYTPKAEPAVKYLRGVAYSKAGRADLAEKMWRQVVRDNDRLYKIRAELALVDLGVATRSLTPKQAVDRLEGLRFAWRGDDLELDILKRLGGFYMDAKNFRMGFQVLTQILRLFPSAPQIPALRDDMSRTFKDLYTTKLGAGMSPIDALSLYTDYKSLIPSGEEGNAVRSNLAERLIEIDLLDQACKLLEEQLKNSTKAEERVKTSTRLAGVRLLDHKAEAALAYLDQSQQEALAMPQAVQDERQLLRVRALSEMGKYQEAVALLPSSNSKATMLLRADIAMRAKNWGDASKALMELIGAPQNDKPLDEEKASWLVNAAMSMARAADLPGLDHLAIEFGPAMDKTSKANIFRILTRPEKMTQMKDLQSAQSKLSEVDMFRSILDGYRSAEKK